eukprot:269904-Prymnesium_polylepis.1
MQVYRGSSHSPSTRHDGNCAVRTSPPAPVWWAAPGPRPRAAGRRDQTSRVRLLTGDNAEKPSEPGVRSGAVTAASAF